MLSRTRRPSEPHPVTRRAAKRSEGPPSVIGEGLHVNGNLISDGEIRVEGTIDGDVDCSRLTIGATGDVRGGIAADDVLVLGKVDGCIRARNVMLETSAHVTGAILHDLLSVAAGAFVDSLCRRIGAGPLPGSAAQAPTPLETTAPDMERAGAVPDSHRT